MKLKNFALVFPGQGSQIVGMGKDFVENFPQSKQVFEEAEDAVHLKLRRLCFEGPADALTLTENLQPALYTVEAAILAALRTVTEIRPQVVAGHSLGEYTALYACQSLNLADGARLTRIRGQQMQKAVPEGEGTMAAILGLTSTQVEGLCTKAMRKNPKEVVEPANFNAPGQTVIAGTVQGVALAIEILNQDMEYKSGKAIPLKVSAPFHCSLMAPAQNAVSLMLASTKFKKPACPIITNTSAQATTNENTFTSSLIDQIVMPVRWEQSMKNLKTHNVQVMIEVGPGKVLTGLQKRIDPEMVTYNLSTVEQLKGLEA